MDKINSNTFGRLEAATILGSFVRRNDGLIGIVSSMSLSFINKNEFVLTIDLISQNHNERMILNKKGFYDHFSFMPTRAEVIDSDPALVLNNMREKYPHAAAGDFESGEGSIAVEPGMSITDACRLIMAAVVCAKGKSFRVENAFPGLIC